MTIASMTLQELLQFAVFPLMGALWWLNKEQSRLDREVVKLITKMDARQGQRDEDRQEQREAIHQLHEAVKALTVEIREMRSSR